MRAGSYEVCPANGNPVLFGRAQRRSVLVAGVSILD